MSTYINEHQGILPAYEDAPTLLKGFLVYLRVRKNRTEKTVNAYYVDLRLFLRFLMVTHDYAKSSSLNFQDVDISSCPDELILSVTPEDIDAFLYYSATEMDNQVKRRARKLSAIKSFYRYLTNQAKALTHDPAADVEAPSLREKPQPVYMTYDQCLQLLGSIHTEATSRDHCIITLFLNSGVRISELVGLDLSRVFLKEGYFIVLGKGRKERTVYLTAAAKQSLERYLEDRSFYKGIVDEKAVFVSQRTGKRLTARGVQVMVEKALKNAGLGGLKLSPHKFRHTAATLMYDAGTDILTVSNVLGHKSVATSEIYTHLHGEKLREAVASSPLSAVDVEGNTMEPPEKEEP